MLELRDAGLILGVGGVHNNVLRLSPPLTPIDNETAEALALSARVFARHH
jgi:4-aminobutyrate aminotransferase